MDPLDFLPATTYAAPPSMQAHRKRRSLNTIIEEEEAMRVLSAMVEERRGLQASPKTAIWRSPMSDHFPTPRGKNFMPAPVMPPSPSSVTTTESSNNSSGQWTRDSFGTQQTDFDELYDVSSDEEGHGRKGSRATSRKPSARKATTEIKRNSAASVGSLGSRGSLPALVIPAGDEDWGRANAIKKLTSPIPPTPPPKVPVSPAVYQYLSAHPVPSTSATPSLDGSLTSEQMAAMSAPPTPDLGNDEVKDSEAWGGVQLQPGAMATLQALSSDELFEEQTEQVIEISQLSPETEMQQSPPPLVTSLHRHNSVVLSPDQERAMSSLTMIDIPSPGGFFSSLSNSSRSTWHIAPFNQHEDDPPSSTTAEHFYKVPWAPTERIVEASESMSDEPLTARPKLRQQDSDETITGVQSPDPGGDDDVVPTEILRDFDASYVNKLKEVASEHVDRTKLWLTAQKHYLAALIDPTEEQEDEVPPDKKDAEPGAKKPTPGSSPDGKKHVRFSELPVIEKIAQELGVPVPKPGRHESAYFRSFQRFVNRSRYRDTFVHRFPRFESLQIQRVNFPEAHRNYLMGKYQLSVVPMSPQKRLSANVARGDELLPDDPERFKSEKEREAMRQMASATWNVMAAKMLNGGRLIAAPVAKRLARLSRMGPTANGTPRDRARILDLGGQATCDWAWHCATEYPNAKIYTVTTKSWRQLSNSNIRGPRNHRQVAINKLTKLPFKDNQFDLISARYLYSMIKSMSEHGVDEYDACLAECMRTLKPGGYLEFSILDSDIINAGPLGLAKSVEFGFSLRTRGYDPEPTKSWISRLDKAGFVSIKRAWLILPMGGPPAEKPPTTRDSMGIEQPLQLEAMVMGSTATVSSITGLLGSWAWEKWMLKLETETGKTEEKLLDGVYHVIEEGRKCGAGWRTLNGWARKPLEKDLG